MEPEDVFFVVVRNIGIKNVSIIREMLFAKLVPYLLTIILMKFVQKQTMSGAVMKL